ncbi:hypothetical protein P775_10930 [Puniceibacterium antarcticum]|uniref:Uncharacterized protein n=1 Tax=Puniceibacterium antarcticum TaxID=1206336 RepID=A0A2G8RF23_9RHOB|nr:hypothetical protein [Puniceibacterium antarcticum]PIL20175.1 hypothetical protein P775_10930 [Puniceibacterium antarcticum]
MIFTDLAIAVLALSTLMALSHLRPLMRDTVQALRAATTRILYSGRARQNLAFGALWMLIFVMSLP